MLPLYVCLSVAGSRQQANPTPALPRTSNKQLSPILSTPDQKPWLISNTVSGPKHPSAGPRWTNKPQSVPQQGQPPPAPPPCPFSPRSAILESTRPIPARIGERDPQRRSPSTERSSLLRDLPIVRPVGPVRHGTRQEGEGGGEQPTARATPTPGGRSDSPGGGGGGG